MASTQEFTTSAYVRAHGKLPRGTGAWAFQRSRTLVAFDRDLFGEVVFVYAESYSKAKAEMARRFAGSAPQLWAVCS